MKNLTFEIHTNAPELNKVFYNGKNVNRLFSCSTLKSLCKDYKYNARKVRQALKPRLNLRHYKCIATRPNGTTETRFFASETIQGVLKNINGAKAFYNMPNTVLKFEPYTPIC